MNTFSATRSSDNNKVRPSQIIGGALGFIDEIGFEMEISPKDVIKEVGSAFFESLVDLGQGVTGVEPLQASVENQTSKLAIGGQTELKFNENKAKMEEQEKKRKEMDRKQTFYQSLRDEQLRTQMAKDRMWLEEEINDITANISTTEKNELLHYQASYKDKSIYQKAELRRKIIEQRKKADKQQKETSVAQTKPGSSALQTAFEGGSGSQGSGTANLSSQAAG